MDNSWFEKAAKSGLLGSRAKVSADTGRAEWSSHDEEKPSQNGVGRARKSLVERLGNALQPGAHAKEKGE